MTITEIAAKLAAYCRKGDWQGAYDELYAENATSTEPYASPLFEKETNGLDAMRVKARKFDNTLEKVYSHEVSQPMAAGNGISLLLTIDAEQTGRGRICFSELCLYQVAGGKIVSETFFYD